ncbi:Txe/YoeB family addiction module toxin [Parapedobacter sp. DT-150]|uniref:Txe/YoeB family addiction module toxin n=1 Tax=Parapedobacter sp. DT-150 TaxID=3396162 RepID=UPI003F1995A4
MAEKFVIIVKPEAQKDIQAHKKSGNNAAYKKIEKILVELQENPYTGTGAPEKLKHELSGYWSRRINRKDRLVYAVQENVVTVTVVSAMGHYDDK